MILPDTPLQAICDADACERAGWSLVDFADACLQGGARLLQIRAKSIATGRLLDVARAIVDRADRSGAVVIVNDRADVARLAGAAGVHVGQDDLSPEDVRKVLGADAIVGLSTHTPEQIADAVQQPVNYVAVGPVFGTTTKATGYDAVGLARVRLAADAAAPRQLPVVAIGGMTLELAPGVIAAGAASVAVIGDLLRTGDPERRVRQYLDALS